VGVRTAIGDAAILILVCGLLCCALVRETPAPGNAAEAEHRPLVPAALTGDVTS
jgi:hypothetical protein